MSDKEWLIEQLYEWGNKENNGVRKAVQSNVVCKKDK